MFQFKLGLKKKGKKKKTKEGERKKNPNTRHRGALAGSSLLKKKKKKRRGQASQKMLFQTVGRPSKRPKWGRLGWGCWRGGGRNLGTSDNSEHTPPLFRGRGGRPVKKRDRSKFAQMKRSRRSPSSPALLPPFTLPLSFTPRH